MSEKKTIESNAVKILRAATWAAETAARATLDQLEAAGSKYVVHESDILGKKGRVVGEMLDLCGGAYLQIPGTTSFIRELKKVGKLEVQTYSGDFWSIWKSVYKGYQLSISFPLQCRQEMSIHVAAMKAALRVLRENGVDATMKSYID